MGCCCLLPRPRTRARAHSRAHTWRTRLSLLRKAAWGAAPHSSPEGSRSLRVPARAHTSNARGPPWCVSLGRTPSLCHLRPGSPARRARGSSLLRTRARAHSDAKSMSLSRLLRPLPYPSLPTWTQHTPSVLHARSFPRTWVTYCTWELHPARP